MTRRLRKSNFESPICKRFYDKILFPKSASLRENVQFLKYEVFDRFWSKHYNFSTFKKIYKARFWKKNWEAVAKSVEENWRLLVLMSVNNFTVQFTFWKLRALTKSIRFPKNYGWDMSVNVHVGPKDNFRRMNFEESGGPSKSLYLKGRKKTFPFPLPV